MRPLILSILLLSVACAHSRRDSNDVFDDSPRPKRSSASIVGEKPVAPPTSFVVIAEDDDEPFEETASVSLRSGSTSGSSNDYRETESRRQYSNFDNERERPASVERDSTPPPRLRDYVEEPPKRKSGGVPIIIESPRASDQDSVFVAAAEPKAAPVRTSEAAPRDLPVAEREPVREPVPERTPAPARRVVPAPEREQPKDDSLRIAEEAKARLDREIEEISGQPAKKEQPRKRQEQDLTERPKKLFDQEPEPSKIGISLLVGAGAGVTSNTRGGYTTALAYGGQLALKPSFSGPVALDLSFWRTANTSQVSSFAVTQSFNNFAVRVLLVKEFSKAFYSGFGGGFLMTQSSSSYVVNANSQDSIVGAAFRPGIDGSVVAGVKVSYFETRLDLRVLGRGLARMDFLPTLSVGANF